MTRPTLLILALLLAGCASTQTVTDPCRTATDMHRELTAEHGQNWRDWPETERARMETAIQKCHESRQ